MACITAIRLPTGQSKLFVSALQTAWPDAAIWDMLQAELGQLGYLSAGPELDPTDQLILAIVSKEPKLSDKQVGNRLPGEGLTRGPVNARKTARSRWL